MRRLLLRISSSGYVDLPSEPMVLSWLTRFCLLPLPSVSFRSLSSGPKRRSRSMESRSESDGESQCNSTLDAPWSHLTCCSIRLPDTRGDSSRLTTPSTRTPPHSEVHSSPPISLT